MRKSNLDHMCCCYLNKGMPCQPVDQIGVKNRLSILFC